MLQRLEHLVKMEMLQAWMRFHTSPVFRRRYIVMNDALHHFCARLRKTGRAHLNNLCRIRVWHQFDTALSRSKLVEVINAGFRALEKWSTLKRYVCEIKWTRAGRLVIQTQVHK